MKKLLLAASLFVSTLANAGEIKPYTESTFNELQSNGSPILIDVNAKWCGTCKKQGKIINKYKENSKNSRNNFHRPNRLFRTR